MRRARTCGLARARIQVLRNSVSWMLRVKTLSALVGHWRNSRRIKHRKQYKVRVSVHWRAQCHAKWPRGGRDFHYPAGIRPTSSVSLLLALTTKPQVRIDLPKQNGIWIVISHNVEQLEQNFCVQDLHIWVATVEDRSQKVHQTATWNLKSKHLISFYIDWTYHGNWDIFLSVHVWLNAHRAGRRPQKCEMMRTENLGHIFKTQLNHVTAIVCSKGPHSEILSLHTVQCSLSRSSTSEKWKLRAWNLGQIFEIELWIVGQLYNRWLFSVAHCSKYLEIENRSSHIQCRSLHGFVETWLSNIAFHLRLFWLQTVLTGCYQFRIMLDIVSKLCLQPFEVLCSWIGIWADAFF